MSSSASSNNTDEMIEQQMSTSSSSIPKLRFSSVTSSSSIQKSFKYDVFLSFRGEDTRKNFVDHLYHALHEKGIITFKDDVRLEIGKQISKELSQSIEDSKIYIIVLSKTYASSSWCLNELVKILECSKNSGHTAYPVFYDVEPTEVRKQSGAVGEAFDKLKMEESAGKWRKALKEAANLVGSFLKNTDDGHEAKFVKRIAEYISRQLRYINMYIDKKMVGMERRINDVLSSLESSRDEVRMIGISGIGGGGKTTLARAVFDKIYFHFEGTSFVENIREVSEKHGKSGLQSLQKQVIVDVSNEKDIILTGVGNGKNMMMKMLRGKKVLIVLDDVDHNDHLEALAGEPNWFKAGSIFIITTRNKQVLKAHGVMPIHDVDLLSDMEAKCLLNRYAFRADIPNRGYEELCLEVVRYADGLPLLIRVLGLFLYGKDADEWRDQLKRLKKIPMKEPLQILELSYIGLEDEFKEIFLDVACFLKGSPKDDAIRILESCGFSARSGLKDLELKSLITISKDQHLGMHARIQDMGRYIVSRSCPDVPEKHSRLWEREKIKEVLANESESVETRAIALDDCLGSEIVGKGFGNMKHLRFLRMVSKIDENTHRLGQNFPSKLRYLNWDFYPHCSLPRTFRADNLVALEMSDCRIKKLWEGDEKKALENLRFLVLSHSKLTSLDLDLTPNIERLDLEECQHLEQIHMVHASLRKLVFLNLTGCSSIHSLFFIKKLESLEVLHLSCLSLERFPDIIPSAKNNRLLELHFRDNKIEELPTSIGNLKYLVYLDLHYCRKLRSLPGVICGLQVLKNLDLYGCTLEELPKDIGRLECLEKLNLSRAHLKHLPDSICLLKNLITLDLSYCFYLEKLPEDLGQLECLVELILTECTRIRDIPGSICKLKNLKCFCLLDCIELKRLPDGLELLESLEELNLKGTRIKIPRSILSLQGLTIDDTSSSSGTLKASSTIKKQKYYHK